MKDTTGGRLELLVLGAVGAGAMHGYAVIDLLRERSSGTFDLAEGTVYPVLHRLEARGHLRSRWSDGPGRRRRLYRLTPEGESALHAHRRDWQVFAAAVNATVGSR
jgi:DNA-binding PadR family transcriptional regulator